MAEGELKDAQQVADELGCTRNTISTWARRLDIAGTLVGKSHCYTDREVDDIKRHLLPNLERKHSKKVHGPGRRPKGDELYEEAAKLIYSEMMKGRMLNDYDLKRLTNCKRAHGLVDYMTARYDIYEETIPGRTSRSWTGIWYGAASAYGLREDVKNGNNEEAVGDGPGDTGKHTEVHSEHEGKGTELP